MGLFGFLQSRSLASVLAETHKVKIHGVKFELRKLNPLDYVSGAKALISGFDTYKTSSEKQQLEAASLSPEKIKSHYADVFMAAVISPKLTRDPDANASQAIYVQHLMTDWELASELYNKIMELTYGKKKLKSFTSPEKG